MVRPKSIVCYSAFLFCATRRPFRSSLCSGPGSYLRRRKRSKQPKTAALFASREVLEITLQADFHTIRREDRSDEDSGTARDHGVDQTQTASVESQEIQLQTEGNLPSEPKKL